MTIVDSRQMPDGEVLERDVCVIGAGPAAIAFAWRLLESGVRVALIESGGPEPGEAQELADGDVVGLPYPDLSAARLRAFGGSTWHWSGNVNMLDTIDFEERPWIPESGWPLTRESLAPYYALARSFFGLPDAAFDVEHWARVNGAPWPTADDAVISRMFGTVGEDRLYVGLYWRPAVEASRTVELFHHATVLEVVADEEARRVDHLRVRTPEGKSLQFRARIYVLAAGGIENPRILLLSNNQQAEGLGNEHDLVGRYFQEHLTVPTFATFYPSNPMLPLGFYSGSDHDWGEAWGILRCSRLAMTQNSLPNIRYQLATVVNQFNKDAEKDWFRSLRYLLGLSRQGADVELGRHVANVIADIDRIADAAYYRLVYHPDYPLEFIEVVHIGEQTPNRDSRVRLSDRRGPYGQRLAALDWRVNENDQIGAWRSANVLKDTLEKSGLGRLDLHFGRRIFDEIAPKPHYHHMGTTRMSAEPGKGVVDADCRVHRCDNLYVAGSSVFPTGGNSNPTFTIVALATRLADHVKARLAA